MAVRCRHFQRKQNYQPGGVFWLSVCAVTVWWKILRGSVIVTWEPHKLYDSGAIPDFATISLRASLLNIGKIQRLGQALIFLNKSKSMRKLTTLFFALIFGVNAFCCVVDPGKLVVQKDGDTYKIWLDREPLNTCFQNDSSSLRVTITCKAGQSEVNWLKTTDTLHYQFSGDVIISPSVTWWNRGRNIGRTDQPPTCLTIQGNGLCFKKLATIEAGEPDTSTENPPPAQEFDILIVNNNLVVNAPWPGELRVFDSMGHVVAFETFDEGHFNFDCEALDPGLFFLNVLLFRPNGLISETLQIWH